jgi:hypothetical protein
MVFCSKKLQQRWILYRMVLLKELSTDTYNFDFSSTRKIITTVFHTTYDTLLRWSYTQNWNCGYVWMFAYSLKRNKPICCKLVMLKASNWEGILGRSELQKIVMSLSSSESGSSNSGTMQDGRVAPRPELFVSVMYRNRSHNPKIFWV